MRFHYPCRGACPVTVFSIRIMPQRTREGQRGVMDASEPSHPTAAGPASVPTAQSRPGLPPRIALGFRPLVIRIDDPPNQRMPHHVAVVRTARP